jgi:hypothetical protein
MQALQMPYYCDTNSCGCSSRSSSGSGSGGFAYQQYWQDHGEPNAISFLPTNQSIPNYYTDLDTGVGYAWVPGELRWI